MRKEESRTDLGAIRIHKDVIASIASLASLEVEGVKKIGGDFKASIYELLGKKEQRGISVEIDRNDEVRLSVPLVVRNCHSPLHLKVPKHHSVYLPLPLINSFRSFPCLISCSRLSWVRLVLKVRSSRFPFSPISQHSGD